MTLASLVVDVDRALADAGLAHAFGGALALAYATDPRGTVDIDVNVFAPVESADVTVAALAPLGLVPDRPSGRWMPAAGIRLNSPAGFPVDVFLSLDEHYAEVERRCIRRPFGPDGAALPFLSAEDLALFKLSFGRDKDWVDLRAIAAARPDLDVAYIERQLLALRGPSMHPRLARLRRLLRPPNG